MFRAGGSGEINYLINNLSFLLLVTSLSLESALTFFASKNEIGLNKLTGISIVFAIISAVASGAIFAIIREGSGFHVSTFVWLIPFTYVFGVVLTNYFSGLFYARNNPVLPNAILVVVNLIVIVFALFDLGYLYDPENRINDAGDLLIVYFASFPLQGLALFIAWLFETRGLKISLPNIDEMRRLLNYAFAALIGNIIFFLVYRVDYWFVRMYCDEAALGNYIQVSKLGQIFLLLPSIIATAVFTRTAGGNQEQIRSVIEIISRWLMMFYLVFVVIILITGRWLFPMVYGESFNMMYGPFMLLAPGIVALSTLSLLTAFYAGRNKLSINIKGSVIALVIIVTGNFLFIPEYGIVAAAMVSSIGYICFQVYVLYQFRKEYRSNLLAFFIPKLSDWDKVKEYIRAEAN